MKKLWIVLLFISLTSIGFGNNRDKDKNSTKLVAGKITNQYGESLAGAQLTIVETGEIFYADLDGNFKISYKAGELFTLSVNTLGYNPRTIKSQDLSLFSTISVQEL